MLIALAVLCALVESVFTALEVALGAASRARLRGLLEISNEDATGDKAAISRARSTRRTARALRVLDDNARTTLLFITVTSLLLWTATAALTWQALRENWPPYVLPLALTGILFLAEVLPVLLAAPRPETLALRGAGFIEFSLRVLAPLLWLTGGAGRALAQTFGAQKTASTQVTEDELRTALAAAEQEGAIESGERALLEGAMDFRARVAREVMTTRREIAAVSSQATLHEILQTAIEAGHSRLPVFDGTLDKVIGIASTKDLIPHLRAATSTPANLTAREIMRAPFFVPETKRIAPLLDELRGQRSLMAIVVDDNGVTTGLVTLEDLLEEIVGDIQDEYDAEEPTLGVLTGAPDVQAIACDGGVSVRDAERFWEKSFGVSAVLRDADGEEADDTISLAALALHVFDGVPRESDCAAIGKASDAAGKIVGALQLEVLRMDGPRIEQIKIEAAKIESAENSDSKNADAKSRTKETKGEVVKPKS